MAKLRIPKEAMPVVKVLRRDVKKPSKREMYCLTNNWKHAVRWPLLKCPMGLHKKSCDRVPMYSGEFAGGECTHEEVTGFYRWWDRLTLPQAKAAVDLIWPTKKAGAS